MTEIPNKIGPVELEKQGRRLIMRFPINDAIRLAIKEHGAHFEPNGPYWWIGTGKADKVIEAIRAVVADQAEKHQEKARRQSAGLLLKHRKTFDCKRQIQELGGTWDKANKGWLMPDQEAFDAAKAACDTAAATDREAQQEAREATRNAPDGWRRMQSKYKGQCEYTGRHIKVGDWIWWHRDHGTASGQLEQPPEPLGDTAILLSGGSGYNCSGWYPGQIVRNQTRELVGYLGSARERAAREGVIDQRVADQVGEAPEGLVAKPYRPYRQPDETDAAYAGRLAAFESSAAAYTEWEQRCKDARSLIAAEYPLDGPEWLYVVRARAQFVREDGLSFGVGDEEGHLYHAWCRAATAEEAAEAIAAHQKKVEAKALAADAAALFDQVTQDGVYVAPEGGELLTLEGTPVYLSERDMRQVVYGGGRWFVVVGDDLWAVRNNGADGDDWSRNNIRTGGAGAVGYRLPLDETTRAVVERLIAAREPSKAV